MYRHCTSRLKWYAGSMKRLYRSKSNKMIAGVCAGLAEYFNVDPVIIRIIAVILLLPGGFPGLVPYVILWVIVPFKPTDQSGTVR